MEVAFQSGFASAALQILFQKFADFAARETAIILGADARLRKLQRTIARIQAMLECVEDGHVRFTNDSCKKAWGMWLEDLNKLCYDADDLLDELSLKLPNFNGVDQINGEQVKDLLWSPLNILVPREIEDVCRKLEDMVGEMDGNLMNQFVEFEPSRRLAATSCYGSNVLSHCTGSLVDEDLIIGRGREVGEIIGMLLSVDGAGGSNVSVIPITGMAGVGKTALAQVVYNSVKWGRHFDVTMWVYVSIEFDVIRIMKSIIESILGKPCELSNFDLIQSRLQVLLHSKRFLLVLDDFWSVKHSDWKVLSLTFRYALPGSKVVVTTRNLTSSYILGTTETYDLQLLSDEDCWQVMRQEAFPNVNDAEREALEQLGRDIATKCKGLPLAAKTLGSVLQATPRLEGWRLILESELWELPQEKNDIIPALGLSYFHLPAHLKKCFTYCSIFPHNHVFEVDDLVLLWIAEGFVEPMGNRRLEDIGREYLMDLLRRSIFQCSDGNYRNPTECKMHDLVHSMAQSISVGICFRMMDGNSQWYPLYKNVRHLSLIHDSMGLIEQMTIPNHKSLRTFILICRGGIGINTLEYKLLLKFRSLRVLTLSNAGIEQLPDSIDHLKHLRYLNVSRNPIQMLPSAITKLFGLQTLKLIDCRRLLQLPTDLQNLTNLRHLHLNTWFMLYSMPPNLGRLTNLQTLAVFKAGEDKGYEISELEQLRLLGGSLHIIKLENVRDLEAARMANLRGKPCLDRLELEWSIVHDRVNQEDVLEGLEPHENLKELVITNYCRNMFPGWLSNPHCKFTSIQLKRGSYSILPSLGELPLLKLLHIEGVALLEQIDDLFCRSSNSIGFPSLESLKFQNMPDWEEWNGVGGNDFPHLRNLSIEDCPSLISLPSLANLHSLEELNFTGCPNLGSLPQLPNSIRNLILIDCTIIRTRCLPDEGDWPMIRAIPRVEIDGEIIQTNAQGV